MKLEQLLEGVSYTLVQGSLELDIEDIIYDSRKAAPGRLFVCIVGTQRDSHDYAAQCVADGVTALVVQHDIDLSTVPGAAVLKVESSRYALALMSGNLFGNPSRRMTMIGVTGTKGKTTTTHMIKSVLEAAGRKVGMIGTNGIYFLGHHQETANTTPESYELQKTFREFLDAGCDTALMEVSSQGLMMDRVAGIHYDIGVFTNLSPDHIGPGEHKTFEEYRSWKGQLFKRCTTGVVNIDDENTEALLEGHTCKLVTYGCSEKADYRAGTYQLLRTHDFLGVQFHVSGKDDMDVKVNMPGEFSVYNALAALAVGKAQELVSLLDGEIILHSTLGKGSTFIVTIPIEPAPMEESQEMAPSEVKHDSSLDSAQDKEGQNSGSHQVTDIKKKPEFANHKILILDDDKLQLQLLQEMLRRIVGDTWHVFACNHVMDALTTLHNEQPALMLMDIEMPEMNGMDMIAHINHTQMMVVAMTAHDTSILEQLQKAGFDDCLFKPFSMEKLSDILGIESHPQLDAQSETPSQPDLSSQQKSNPQLDSLLAFAGGDEEAAKEILDTVKQELAAHLENLKEAVEEESLSTDRIGKAAHKLLPIATMMQMGCLEELKALSPEHIGKIEEAEIRAKLQVVITTLSAAVSDLYAS